MSQMKLISHIDNIPSTPGKFKMEKSPYIHRLRSTTSSSPIPSDLSRTYSWGGLAWEKRVRASARIQTTNGLLVLVTGAAGFVGTHVSAALKRRGDGVLGLDNFNDYYDTSLKRARQALLEKIRAGWRYAMENPNSYVHSNIAGFVSVLEVCKSANPQPAIVWASSSSVYGLNTKVPFLEKDRTDQPASLYAATKKAGEEIAHTYNHIYGLSLTGLRFFTVYGPWGRPDMAYFFFTRDILKGKSIPIFEAADHGTVARDFTYIDDIVKGCLAALDSAEKSTGSGGKKEGVCSIAGEEIDYEVATEWGRAVYTREYKLGSEGARLLYDSGKKSAQ
ncbi:UDP-D-glucuronate 4-epimerase 3 [Actinidia rufa]|uniref:UDP-D-glucuronate 4-epimerase 3 n=1 Tax=Actinidia rufa TaxID=165716 RepID=A0A7J0F6B3_9ERIC|nr:UDP-D-glucuronate 4-epimerase 3 [Actinidia rufa]